MGIEFDEMPADILHGMDRWIDQQVGRRPTREELVQMALVEWLVARGLLTSPSKTTRSTEEHADLTSEPDA